MPKLANLRPPANVLLRRAQLVLMLVALVPTVLISAVGIVLLARGQHSINIVAGVLVLCFCTSSLTGYILGSIFINRGASLARVQNDFLSAVSHELRTPLTSIRLFLETLRDERVTDAEERRKCLEILHTEVNRLDGLVGKLMDLSKIESGRQLFERRPVKVRDVVDDALRAFEAVRLGPEAGGGQPEQTVTPAAAPIKLEVQAEDGLQIVGDRAALSQALLNLLTNAYKYAVVTSGEIAIVASPAGRKRVEIAVCDRGPGIPADEQERIFGSFERGREAFDRGLGGSGLGLAIVRAIARAHDGEVELRSTAGEGSTFRLLLPRHAG